MASFLLPLTLGIASMLSTPQRSAATPAPASVDQPAAKPLPDTRELILEAGRNQAAAEAKKRDYTYHVHLEEQELDSHGNIKKNTVTDSESLTISGVRINRVVARDGKPLNAEETQKESERIDKEVAKEKEHRDKNQSKGEETDSHGDAVLSASRILELLVFSNPRRIDLNGRATIVLDAAGDPNAKTRNSTEKAFRDLVGTVWVDEQDRVLARVQGHFLNDFKIGAGLVADIRKDSSFEASFSRINDEVWLPSVIDGQGKIRIFFFAGFNGRIHLVASDYRKFRASSTIRGTNGAIGPDGQILTPPDTPTGAPKP